MSGATDLPKAAALRLAIRQALAAHALRSVTDIFDAEVSHQDDHVEYLLAKATAMQLELLNEGDICPSTIDRINTVLRGPFAKIISALEALFIPIEV